MLEFEFYSKNYNFIDTPDVININNGEVKYNSDWYRVPEDGKLLQYTKYKATISPFRNLLEDDLVKVTNANGKTFEVIIENPIKMTLRQHELLTNATHIEVIRNVNLLPEE